MAHSYTAVLFQPGSTSAEIVSVAAGPGGRPPERLDISNVFGHLPDGVWTLSGYEVEQHTARYIRNET